MSEHTVQSQIRLLPKEQSDRGLHCLPSIYSLLMHLCTVNPFHVKENYGNYSRCFNFQNIYISGYKLEFFTKNFTSLSQTAVY